MAMVEDFADSAAGSLRNLARALGCSDADVLAGYSCTLANVFRGSDGMKRDEIACAFADAFGCSPGSPGGSLADVASSAADVTAWAAGLGRWRGLGLRGGWRGGRRGGGGLRILGKGALAADSEA